MQYLAALGFYETGVNNAKQINLLMGNESFRVSPVAAVNLSFSAELFLKLIYLFEYDKSIYKHRLDEIFKELPQDLQLEIDKEFEFNKENSLKDLFPIKLSFNVTTKERAIGKDPNDILNLTLFDLLKIHSNGFVNWRYAYEKKDHYYYYEFNFNLMREFIKSLITIIDRRYKESFILSRHCIT